MTLSAAKLIQGLLGLLVFILVSILAPLILIIYSLFWLWVTFVSYFFAQNYQILNGEDVMVAMDDYQTNSIVNGMVIVKGKLTVEMMRELVTSTIIAAEDKHGKPLLPKYTQCVVECLDYWFWKPKENFNIKEHIRYYSENPMCTKIELNLAVNDIFNWSIPFSRPLWEIILIKCLIPDDILDENVEPKTALVIRAHHAMGDGVSFVRTFFSLMVGKNDDMEMILEKAVSRRKASVKNDFKHKLNIALQRIYMFVFSPAVLIRPLFIQEKHLLHGHKLTGVVITNWSTNIKLETIKAIKNSTSTTVNDVIMTCLAGAIRRYFLRKKTTPPNSVNIYIPVNLQGPNDVLSNKNRLSFVIPKLATGDIDCLTRLKETKFIMDEIKTSPQIMAHQFLFKFSGSVLPNSVIKKIQSFSPCAFILSNLPGPDNKMSLCGCELESVIPMATTRSSTGVGLLVFSYGGKINISTTIDTALITDPSDTSSLLKDIETEVNQLYNCDR